MSSKIIQCAKIIGSRTITNGSRRHTIKCWRRRNAITLRGRSLMALKGSPRPGEEVCPQISQIYTDYILLGRVTPCAPLASYLACRGLAALPASDSAEICEICGSIFDEHQRANTRSNGATAAEHGLAARRRAARSVDGTAAPVDARRISDECGSRRRGRSQAQAGFRLSASQSRENRRE